jgi:hypothetical protein
VHGDVSPLEGFPPIGALEGASVAPFIAQSAIARRASLGEQLLPTFTARQEQLHHVLAGLTSQDWDTPCYHFVGPFPVRAFYTLRVTELALHGWDIRSALEPGASLFPKSLPVLMDLATLRVGGNFRPGVRLAVPIRYRFVVTGVVPGTPDLVVEGDQAHWEPRGSAEAHVTYHCDTETFVLLMYSRLTQETATAKGRLVSEGDGQWAVAFDQWFKGS